MDKSEFGLILKTITGMDWEEQYDIDNGKYKLDYFLPYTLIVEYEEEHLNENFVWDHERMMYCRNWLYEIDPDGFNWKHPVIIINKGEELEGLNRIIRHLAGFESFDTQINYNLQVCDYGNR